MGDCVNSQVNFDTTTLEKIVQDPEWVLENEDAFWSTYRAQILTSKWAEFVNYDISREKWRSSIKEWLSLSPEVRENHELMKTTQRILSAKGEFLEKALPHDCSFLPEGVDLSVTVQFTAFVPPFAFAMEDIVIDVASPYWKGNPEHILNLLVHELFHVGYSHYRTLHSEQALVPEDLYNILDNIVCEGICTYVGYCALPIFPVEDERDYRLLQDMVEVHRLFAETNAILAQYEVIPALELQKLSWDQGVLGRAYYITGAHMCKMIADTLGRDALIEVYSTGPLSIINRYNTIAVDDLRVELPSFSRQK